MSNDVLESKIDIIERNIRFLREYDSVSPEEFLNSFKDIQAVKFCLLELMAATIDVAAHLISKRGLERGESYADLFLILGKEKLIEIDLARRLSQMARFRNLLVHGYSKIDDLRVLQLVKERLVDIEEFLKQVMKL